MLNKPFTVDEFWDIKHQIDDEVARLGWTKDQCRVYLFKHYKKHSRLILTDEQLIDLLERLRAIQPVSPTQTSLSRDRKKRRRKRN